MKRILIANRGEIALRIMATARRMGIDTVAVYSDADAGSLHVQQSTQAYALGGLTSAQSYLDMHKLLAAAKATGADAVHPGYGFLSEDAGFAQAVQEAGLIWIGPPPAAIRQLGSKAAAKQLAKAHGVPCLPGYEGDDQCDARFADEAAMIGYPVMVKAVAGGGGRGMRLVESAKQLHAALNSARSEALAGFGNGDLLVERAVMHPRHVEVQVFADGHGHVIHLGERDCSVQRRHQKIIEEAPSPAVNAELREQMGSCAVALAKAAGYVGAGTVEFLVEGRQFYLMEMNTRLQVEHPVTEALTGLDLVEWQIRVARGEALPLTQQQVRLDGHAIEVRLCAEDENFQPHTGVVRHFSAPEAAVFSRAPLRFDHALHTGSEVTPYYDAMLGKLIVHAPTREQTIDRLIHALGRLTVLGLPTNRAFLIECLNDEVFRRGQALISYLASDAPRLQQLLRDKEVLAHQHWGALCAVGQRPGPLACSYAQLRKLQHRGRTQELMLRPETADSWLLQRHGAEPALLQVDALLAHGWRARAAGLSQTVQAVELPAGQGGARWHLQAGDVDWWVEDASYAPPENASAAGQTAELRAPFNGRVVQLGAVAGQALKAGDVVVVIESMKLEHSLSVKADCRVEAVLVNAGQQVAPGQVLLKLAPMSGGPA
ncbi:acetyl/propionyl/methylcrotonyl-CoA carboxylase subunit alpha [Comamonas thiooxydans]|uniref:acetyl/propionyl/methylcrotonyl-CoA carboxylase subunit alpha n=1 Tax=Comamonas thiooxydans TaxID=363952 RepID=UPI0007C4EC42|nr:biotin carboxylase N-terminal domain-containing protein [Comamonas thiooxydans]MCO8250605.1 ATP-grasp domain-containing protein [Comamonas thiooxydans]OAD86054.1 carbamoyl-phosphate synthase large subunit [Comamonas thiooxydans]UBQ43620.1 ATP-grasp domain-containing protein [Comamonas thiooxydans]